MKKSDLMLAAGEFAPWSCSRSLNVWFEIPSRTRSSYFKEKNLIKPHTENGKSGASACRISTRAYVRYGFKNDMCWYHKLFRNYYESPFLRFNIFLTVFQLIILACGTLITCVMPEWRKSDLQGQVIEMQISKQGIWWNCMFFSTGNWHCDDYDRVLLGLPAELQTARALMVLACILGFLGYCLSQVGLGCTTFMEDNQASKRKSEHISKINIIILISELNYIIILF